MAGLLHQTMAPGSSGHITCQEHMGCWGLAPRVEQKIDGTLVLKALLITT